MFASLAKRMRMVTDAAAERSERVSASSYPEILAFYGLLATILVSSIPYGTAAMWHKSLLVAMIGVFAGFRVLDGVVRGPFRVAEPIMLLPLVGVLCLAIFQLVPWPGFSSPISIDPYETKSFILIFGGLIAACEVLFFYSNARRRIKYLIGLVIAVGVGSALFGIAREIYLDTQTDLLRTYLPPSQGYAQFINRNHFEFLMEMAFGLLLGILIKGELSEKLKFCGWIFGGILIYAAITANSRGGLLGLTALILLAVPLHLITPRREADRDEEIPGQSSSVRTWTLKTMGAVSLCGLVFVLIVTTIAFVGGDAVVSRIEKVKAEVEAVNPGRVNRNLIWKSSIELIKNEPVFGVGFGGYAAAIPKFDSSGGAASLQQAHNDYLEILANGGIVGFVLFGTFGAIVVSRTFKNLKSTDTLTRASCFGAALGMFGVLIHSFVDFGLHIMTNALILTVLVVIATGDRSEWSECVDSEPGKLSQIIR